MTTQTQALSTSLLRRLFHVFGVPDRLIGIAVYRDYTSAHLRFLQEEWMEFVHRNGMGCSVKLRGPVGTSPR